MIVASFVQISKPSILKRAEILAKQAKEVAV